MNVSCVKIVNCNTEMSLSIVVHTKRPSERERERKRFTVSTEFLKYPLWK